jgi:hypothetical protein
MFKSKLHFVYLASFSLIIGGLLVSLNPPRLNQTSTDTTSVLALTTCSLPTTAISLVYNSQSRLEIKLDTQTLTDISRVDFIFIDSESSGNEILIGKGLKDTTTLQMWRTIWDTRFYKPITASFPGRFKATVRFKNNTACTTPVSGTFSIPTNNTTTTPTIDAVIMPTQWNTLVNTSINVNVDLINIPPELQPFVLTNWQPQIGFISSPFTKSSSYFSGSSAGNGKLKINVVYSGKSLFREIDVAVYTSSTQTTNDTTSSEPSTTDTSSPEPTTTNTTDTTDTTSSDDATSDDLPELADDADLDSIITTLAPTNIEPSKITAPSRAIALILNSNQEIKTCIATRLGDTTLSNILRENRRPRSNEFKRLVNCFEQQRNVIPSILAPVAPEEVKAETLVNPSAVAIKNLTNAKKQTESGSDKTTLVISGSAKPNESVLLYVFSEPLVLATLADSDGNWTYSLEDPLDAGEHEVYALVDRGDGVYESSNVASFFIGSAEATEENPDGLSLELITEPTVTANNRSANIYIAATVGIVVFSATVVAGLLIIKFNSKKPSSIFEGQIPTDASEDVTYKEFTDRQ